jgi:two-component system chemotaxis sensor kinase CheA
MEDLINSFLEEASELINDLEDSLLTLEEMPTDQDAINRVFRVMHTLKGSGGMFGFNSVSDFTHHLESIYYKIRNNELKVTKEILTVTLKSVDLIKELLTTTDGIPENSKAIYKELIEKIKNITNKEEKEPVPVEEKKEEKALETPTEITNKSDVNTYYIRFEPNTEILQNGTNPLYLIDELIDLGDAYVILNTTDIPNINELNIEYCYVSWEIILASEVDKGDIMDVFIFVEDESHIDIQNFGNLNLLHYPEFKKQLDQFQEENSTMDTSVLIDLAENLKKKSPPKTVKKEVKKVFEKDPVQETEPPTQAAKVADTSEEKDNIQSQTPQAKVKPSNKSFSTIRVSSHKIETLMNLVSEMVTSQARLNLLAEVMKNPELSDAVESLEKLTRQLRDNAFEISLIPIESMLTRFKRLIRDLSAEVKKEVEFNAEGTDTELDKTIIESLSDPLLHIFRNALDHGIEDAETRKRKGKPVKGRITLKAFYSGTNVFIQITDDGGGIDPEKIRAKAIQKGMIDQNTVLSKREMINLIALPGFSTAESISEISGRGVGMDVVKKNIQKIQGELLIDSTIDVGTTFTLKLPLTLSIIDGLIVLVDQTSYIIPISLINKIRPFKHEVIAKAFNNTLSVDNEQLPFIYLRDKFGSETEVADLEQLIVVNYENQRIGIVVDKVEKQSQVVVKSIGKQFHYHDIISGASIMGNGQVALVLDTNKIITSIEKERISNQKPTK